MSSRDLFINIVKPSITLGSRKWYAVPLSIAAHVAGIGALVIVPLMAATVLPTPPTMLAFVTATPPPEPPPAPPPASDPQRRQERAARVARDMAPVEAPREITPEISPLETNLENELARSVVPGLFVGDAEVAFEPPPPPPPVKPLRVGGKIQPPQKIRHVDPVYPAIARAAHVQGVVIIEATISPNGRVQAAKILRSLPLLDQAALEAVNQWEFRPTLLNGLPVAVVMTVTVNFRLE